MKKLWFAFAFLSLAYSCVKDDYAPEYAKPIAASDVTVWDVGISDFSGVCVSYDKSFLWGVSNSEGIYKLDFEGNIIEHTLKVTNDFEGITLDGSNGNIYLVEESGSEKASNSNSIYSFNPDTKALDFIYKVDIANSVGNKGLEGIAVVGEELWVCNQDAPKIIIKYNPASKTVTGSLELGWAGFINDLAYDPDNGTLWMTDTQKGRLVNFSKDGLIIKTYSTESIIRKPEGVALDKNRNCIWLCCDDSGQLAKMKYKF
jgi:uncharacterized protein YjiK